MKTPEAGGIAFPFSRKGNFRVHDLNHFTTVPPRTAMTLEDEGEAGRPCCPEYQDSVKHCTRTALGSGQRHGHHPANGAEHSQKQT